MTWNQQKKNHKKTRISLRNLIKTKSKKINKLKKSKQAIKFSIKFYKKQMKMKLLKNKCNSYWKIIKLLLLFKPLHFWIKELMKFLKKFASFLFSKKWTKKVLIIKILTNLKSNRNFQNQNIHKMMIINSL